MPKVAILIVDDHRIIRQGLRYLIESVPDMTVVGEAHDGRDAQRLVDEQHPDVIVMDIAMPGLNGIEATRQIVNQAPQARVIALSQFSQRRYVTEMLKAGARGYVLKEDAFEELVTAIQTVLEGRLYLSPQ